MEKRRIIQYVKYFKRNIKQKKEFRLAVFYSVAYFLFITLLLVFSTKVNAQTTGIKVGNPKQENLIKPMNSMMDKIYAIKMSGDFDKDYVSIMKEFQQGGIDLCKIYEMSGDDPKLVENAKVSVVELKEHEKQLKPFVRVQKHSDNRKPEHNDLMATLNQMIKEMKYNGHSGEIGCDFAAMMALYNRAGLEMAKAELKYGNNNALKEKTKDMLEEFSVNENNVMDRVGKCGKGTAQAYK